MYYLNEILIYVKDLYFKIYIIELEDMNTQPHKASYSSSAIVPGKFRRDKAINENSPYFLNLSRQQYKSKTEINYSYTIEDLAKN